MIKLQTINTYITLISLGFAIVSTLDKVSEVINLLSLESYSFLELLIFGSYLILRPALVYLFIQVFFTILETFVLRYDKK